MNTVGALVVIISCLHLQPPTSVSDLLPHIQRHANYVRECQKAASGGANDDDVTSGVGSPHSDASDTADGNTQNYDSDADGMAQCTCVCI